MLEIVHYPNMVLQTPTNDVTEINEDLVKVIARMGEVMYKLNGVGLAANQIGISKRLFVYEMGDKVLRAVINPQILEMGGHQVGTEGCLSIPEKYWDIPRYDKVHMIGLNISGETIEVEAEGLEACIFQHEIDHLDGKTIIDRISKKEKWEAFGFESSKN